MTKAGITDMAASAVLRNRVIADSVNYKENLTISRLSFNFLILNENSRFPLKYNYNSLFLSRKSL